jgi:hypothetical protein
MRLREDPDPELRESLQRSLEARAEGRAGPSPQTTEELFRDYAFPQRLTHLLRGKRRRRVQTKPVPGVGRT